MVYCAEHEVHTPHFPILNPDEYIARWVCLYCEIDQYLRESGTARNYLQNKKWEIGDVEKF